MSRRGRRTPRVEVGAELGAESARLQSELGDSPHEHVAGAGDPIEALTVDLGPPEATLRRRCRREVLATL